MANSKQSARLDPKAKPSFTKGTVYVGQDEIYEVVMPGQKNYGRAVAGRSSSQPKRRNTSLISLLFAILLGALAFGLVRYLRFHYLQETTINETDQTLWIINAVAALAIAMFVGIILRLRNFAQIIGMALGAAAGAATFHNFVHWLPEQFTQLFSAEWVTAMIAASPQNSVLFQGVFTAF